VKILNFKTHQRSGDQGPLQLSSGVHDIACPPLARNVGFVWTSPHFVYSIASLFLWVRRCRNFTPRFIRSTFL